MERTNLINKLIADNGYTSYLEIGYGDGINFSNVVCESKVSVDPFHQPTFLMTSDAFFKQNKEKFDLIFIDGLHQSDQVVKDVKNSLKVLSKGGTILIHDCKPRLEIHQTREKKSVTWNGDVWKAIVQLAKEGYNMELLPIDVTGIVKLVSGKKTFNVEEGDLTWNWYLSNYIKMWR